MGNKIISTEKEKFLNRLTDRGKFRCNCGTSGSLDSGN